MKLVKGYKPLLEQQPCGDCVSRQAVLDKKELVKLEDGQSFYCISPEDVKELSPVTPQQKIIRCKDCKYWTNNISDPELRDNYCNEEAHGFFYRCSGDDYCSFAERISDG